MQLEWERLFTVEAFSDQNYLIPVPGALTGPQFMCPNDSKGEVISRLSKKKFYNIKS